MKSISSQKHTGIAQPDLSKILEPYENQWVALSPDYTHVVASGETLKMCMPKCPRMIGNTWSSTKFYRSMRCISRLCYKMLAMQHEYKNLHNKTE
jgi:hypothetical protein